MGLTVNNASEHCSASWDHVESVLRHEYFRVGEGDQLITLIARMRAAGFDRKLLARRAFRAPLVLARSASRVLGSTEPVIVFVCKHGRIVSLVGTIERFRQGAIPDATLTPQLARALTTLSHEAPLQRSERRAHGVGTAKVATI